MDEDEVEEEGEEEGDEDCFEEVGEAGHGVSFSRVVLGYK